MRDRLVWAIAGSLLPWVAMADDTSSSIATTTVWEGPYAGLNAGLGFGRDDWKDPSGSLANPLNYGRFPSEGLAGGRMGGLTLGYNHSFENSWMAGLEGEIDATSFRGDTRCHTHEASFGWVCRATTGPLVTLDARLGYAPVGATLFYVKGGLAYTRDDLSIFAFNPSGYSAPNPSIESGQDRFGFNAGAGVEYGIGNDLSVKVEYVHYGFGDRAINVYDEKVNRTFGATASQSFDALKIGINRHFGQVPSAPADSDISGEIGARMGWNSGDYRWDQYGAGDNPPLNSRLTWPGTGMMSEVFARIDHHSGIFAKGILGGISLRDGSAMQDEDFPPETDPYSRTTSTRKNSQSLYGNLDIGYDIPGQGWRISPFLGYSYYDERQNAYGCVQTASSSLCSDPDQVGSGQLVLSRRSLWNGIRLGIAGDLKLSYRLTFSAEAAWLPWLTIDGSHDNHWLRPEINPMKEKGDGGGYQAEARLSYRLIGQTSIGAGIRRWRMYARGESFFPDTPVPTHTVLDRTMVFAQISYAFGPSPN